MVPHVALPIGVPPFVGMGVMDQVSNNFPGWDGSSPCLLGYENTHLPLYQLLCNSQDCKVISPGRGLAYALSEHWDFQGVHLVCTLVQ